MRFQMAYPIAMHYPTRTEIEELTAEDRLRLIGDVWDTLMETPDALGFSDIHRAVVEQRLSKLEEAPLATIGLDEMVARSRNRG